MKVSPKVARKKQAGWKAHNVLLPPLTSLLLKEVAKYQFRTQPDVVTDSLLEYAQKTFPGMADSIRDKLKDKV